MSVTKAVKSSLVNKINSLDEYTVKPFAMPTLDVTKAGDAEYLMQFSASLIAAKKKHEEESGAPTEAAQVRFVCASLMASLFPASGSLDDKELGEQMSALRLMVINRAGVHHYTENEFSALVCNALRGEANALSVANAKHYAEFIKSVANREEERNFSSSYKSSRLTKSFADLLVSGIKFQRKDEKDVVTATIDIPTALAVISEGKTPWKVAAKPTTEEVPAPAKPTNGKGKGGK